MSAWKTMEEKPTQPMPVVLYFGNVQYDGEPFEAIRKIAVRGELGFWDGKRWYFAGTGHDVYEDREAPAEYLPTNWQPFVPPQSSESNARIVAGPEKAK